MSVKLDKKKDYIWIKNGLNLGCIFVKSVRKLQLKKKKKKRVQLTQAKYKGKYIVRPCTSFKVCRINTLSLQITKTVIKRLLYVCVLIVEFVVLLMNCSHVHTVLSYTCQEFQMETQSCTSQTAQSIWQ